MVAIEREYVDRMATPGGGSASSLLHAATPLHLHCCNATVSLLLQLHLQLTTAVAPRAVLLRCCSICTPAAHRCCSVCTPAVHYRCCSTRSSCSSPPAALHRCCCSCSSPPLLLHLQLHCIFLCRCSPTAVPLAPCTLVSHCESRVTVDFIVPKKVQSDDKNTLVELTMCSANCTNISASPTKCYKPQCNTLFRSIRKANSDFIDYLKRWPPSSEDLKSKPIMTNLLQLRLIGKRD